MTAWRISVVCSDPELDPFRFHEQLITVEGFPVLAEVLAEHYGHEIQAILVDRLSADGAVRIRAPDDMHSVLFWRELAGAVEQLAAALDGQAGAAEPGAGTPGAG
jgi:hypothetical protein